MKRALPAVAVGLVAAVAAALPAQADVTGSAVQSANIQPESGHGLESRDVQRVFCNLRTSGFNAVTLDIPLFQADKRVPKITPRKAGPGTAATPTDAQLATSIRHARECGLNVILKPHLELPGGEWRAHVRGSRAQQAEWTRWMVHYAKVGRAGGVTTLVIGTEQKGMTLGKGAGARWVSTVRAVRKASPKVKVTYAAHTNDEALLLPKSFVGKLDYLSLTWYPRPPKGRLSVASLEADMRLDKGRYFDKARRRYGKRIVFAETGFRSIRMGDYYAKRGEVGTANVDLELQRMQYEAMLRFLDSVSYVDGVMLYRVENTPDAGGPRDPWFSWQGKPAEKTIAGYFGGKVPR